MIHPSTKFDKKKKKIIFPQSYLQADKQIKNITFFVGSNAGKER